MRNEQTSWVAGVEKPLFSGEGKGKSSRDSDRKWIPRKLPFVAYQVATWKSMLCGIKAQTPGSGDLVRDSAPATHSLPIDSEQVTCLLSFVLWNTDSLFIHPNRLWEHTTYGHHTGHWDYNGEQARQDSCPLEASLLVRRVTLIKKKKKIKYLEVVKSTLKETILNNWKITKLPTLDRRVWKKPSKEW